jgi:formylglycine-generating enzyme required for sulfatase activity
VVKITAKPPQGMANVGTGFIVRLEPNAVYIVTSAHVVAGDAQPKVEFFTKRNLPVTAEVLGLEGDDEVRGLALLVVRGAENLPTGITALSLAGAARLSGGEDILVIGFPRNAGPWALIKGNISSRQGRDIYFSPSVDSGHSGGPVFQGGKVVAVVAAGSHSVGRGITVRSVQDYIEGFGITAQESASTASPPTAPSPPPVETAQLEPRQVTPDREITGKDGAPMVVIPAGEFWMGSPASVVHKVRFSKSFAIARYETTFEEYDRFARATGRTLPDDSGFGRGNRPVINVSWQEAKAYAAWLSRETRKNYRLPTESEWEYAARSGGQQDIWAGTSDERELKRYAVYGAKRTEPVGGRKPNGLGLYDMSGNVWEWVEDCWHEDYKHAPADGSAWLEAGGGECGRRVFRGGSWINEEFVLVVSERFWNQVDGRNGTLGFRLVQDIP